MNGFIVDAELVVICLLGLDWGSYSPRSAPCHPPWRVDEFLVTQFSLLMEMELSHWYQCRDPWRPNYPFVSTSRKEPRHCLSRGSQLLGWKCKISGIFLSKALAMTLSMKIRRILIQNIAILQSMILHLTHATISWRYLKSILQWDFLTTCLVEIVNGRDFFKIWRAEDCRELVVVIKWSWW
jgi:hypothetical protein